MKKFVIFISALILAFSLTACGEDTKESVIEDSLDFLSDVDNVHCTTLTSMNMKIDDAETSTLFNMDADLDIKRGHNYMTMYSNTNGEELGIEFYVDTNQTPALYYVGSGDRWVKMDTADIPDMDVSTNLYRDFEAFYDEFMINPSTTMDVEEIEGEKCFRLQAPITIRSMEMARNFSIDSFVTSFLGDDADQSMVNTVLSYLGPINVTVYVRCDDYSPMGMVLDLKSSLETMYQKLNATDVVVNEAYASSSYTEYNDSDVKIPENVRSAPDMSDISGSANN